MGLEPTTFSLATRRSTTELRPQIKYILKVKAFDKLSNSHFLRKIVKIFLLMQQYDPRSFRYYLLFFYNE